MTQVGLGEDFVIALGLTLPQDEYAKLAAENGVLKQKGGSSKPEIRRIKKLSARKHSAEPTSEHHEK